VLAALALAASSRVIRRTVLHKIGGAPALSQ